MSQKNSPLRKPPWIRVKLPNNNSITKVKTMLRAKHHCTVCEEAACPNLGECFNCGIATFMIMGNLCTRHCKFCNVKSGTPRPLDTQEPENLAQTIHDMKLNYVVITSVTRDDLTDGGAKHFINCIKEIRKLSPDIKIEILTPDFRGCMDQALAIFEESPPDVFNHNIETVPNLFKTICPSAHYKSSLLLLKKHKVRFPNIPTKSGLMVGLGETDKEIMSVLKDLREHDVDMLTLGQYLQPSQKHLPVVRYVTPENFDHFAKQAKEMGFKHVASGPLVRSSYHAEQQVMGEIE